MKYDKTSKDFEYVEKDVFTYPDSTSKIDLYYVQAQNIIYQMK